MKYNFEQTRNDYQTPAVLYLMGLQLINKEEYDLDTCCSQMSVPAKHYCVEGEADGLNIEWEKFNWCNPPYDECDKWVKKAYNEQQNGNTTVMLIPVRTETKYWHDYILFNKNVEIKWLRKGYCFIDPDTKEKCSVFKNALALVKFNGDKTCN